ncbi:MAG: Excinuclease subunit [Pedosphaera sp.]|nr:Excinuclease subunit [Pedosphaera sp.]
MSAQQLHLFDPAKPLLLRFGAEFFRAVPQKPGVYIMGGDAERVLYIGQSKNLRHRLSSYKNARPDRAPRKIIRLVHSVRTIVWEECESAEAARLKENQLLRIHRPKFNVMNVYPQAYRFIGVQAAEGRLILSLLTEPKAAGKIYGAFKGGVRAYASLLRLLWAALRQPVSPFDFPTPLLNSRPPREFHFTLSPGSQNWIELVEKFFAGESDALVPALAEAVPHGVSFSVFQLNLHASDLEILSTFFERGPKRNLALRAQNGMNDPIIKQEQLDDLLVFAERTGGAEQPGQTTQLIR